MTDVSNSMAKILPSATEDFPLDYSGHEIRSERVKICFFLLNMHFDIVRCVTNSIRTAHSHGTSN